MENKWVINNLNSDSIGIPLVYRVIVLFAGSPGIIDFNIEFGENQFQTIRFKLVDGMVAVKI